MKMELKTIGNGCLLGSLMVVVAMPATALELLHAPPAAIGAIITSGSAATATTLAVQGTPTVADTTLDHVYEITPPVPFKMLIRST